MLKLKQAKSEALSSRCLGGQGVVELVDEHVFEQAAGFVAGGWSTDQSLGSHRSEGKRKVSFLSLLAFLLLNTVA